MRVLAAIALVVILAGCSSEAPAPARSEGASLVLGVVGHSFLVGFDRDAENLGNSPEASWPSGEEATSLRALLGASAAENVAQGGAGAGSFLDQVEQLEQATLVVVGFGTNDACAGNVPVPPEAFEAAMREGVQALVARGMDVLLLSEVDLVGLFAASQPPTTPAPGASPPAATLYGTYRACAAKPGMADVIASYNDAIVRVADEEGVLHDAGAQHALAWSSDLLSDIDGFHPNVAGNEILARTALGAYRAASPGSAG